jgi:hypothetical protein
VQRASYRGLRPAAKDQHDAASAAVDRIDQVIELLVQIGMLRERAKPVRLLQRCDLHLLRDIAAEHDPILTRSGSSRRAASD